MDNLKSLSYREYPKIYSSWLDIFLLACFFIGNMLLPNWMISLGISILSLRIIWQFRFHKNCDGQLIVLSILDDPTLAIESEDNNSRNARIWMKLKIIGYCVDLFIIIYWILPFCWSFIQAFF